MVIPVGPMNGAAGMPLPMGAPEVVKERYQKYWWGYFFLLLATVAVKATARDVDGAFNTGIMAFVIWWTTKSNCANMSQCCVFLIGVMCIMNSFFALLVLGAELGGREHRTTECVTKGNETVCTTTAERHDFFDASQGNIYLLQSYLVLFAPILQLLGLLLCYTTYQEYPSELFADENEPLGGQGGQNFGGGPVGGMGRGGGGGAGGFYGGGGGASAARSGGGGSGGFEQQSYRFQGEGQRLGSS